MTDRASAEGRIDALRKAIDHAVSGLNKSWGGFGPNVQLERVISSLQRARTNDDIAQGRDWPPVVLTDPVSTEGLRAALFDCYVLLPPERLDLLRDETKQTIDAAAALRDTGSRPDSDAVLLANAILGGSSYLPHREAAERILARDTGPRPDVMGDSIESALQRNAALRVLALALASQGVPDVNAASLLRDIEEGGYTLRLTTHAERKAKNDQGMSS